MQKEYKKEESEKLKDVDKKVEDADESVSDKEAVVGEEVAREVLTLLNVCMCGVCTIRHTVNFNSFFFFWIILCAWWRWKGIT